MANSISNIVQSRYSILVDIRAESVGSVLGECDVGCTDQERLRGTSTGGSSTRIHSSPYNSSINLDLRFFVLPAYCNALSPSISFFNLLCYPHSIMASASHKPSAKNKKHTPQASSISHTEPESPTDVNDSEPAYIKELQKYVFNCIFVPSELTNCFQEPAQCGEEAGT